MTTNSVSSTPDAARTPPGLNDPDQLVPRAEAYLCLSRAFLPPTEPGALHALRSELPLDLEALHTELPAANPRLVQQFRASLEAIEDDETLLRTYSRLFLSPPAPALLNLGYYLDGSLMGNSTQELEALHQRNGLERAADFRDLPDHLALNLHFLGYLFASTLEADLGDITRERTLGDARGLIVNYLLPATAVLSRKIQAGSEDYSLSPAYAVLANILIDLLQRDAGFLASRFPIQERGGTLADADPFQQEREQVRSAAAGGQLACSACGQSFLANEALVAMVTQLSQEGLATEHLSVCPDCRTRAMGLKPMKPPKPTNKAG